MTSYLEKVKLDAVLAPVVKPALVWHAKVYGGMNKIMRKGLDTLPVPAFMTADFVTLTRTLLLFPTIFLLAKGSVWLPAIFIVVNDLGDFFDGVVARWWIEKNGPRATPAIQRGTRIPSLRSQRLATQWGQYFDAVADKCYVVPVWTAMLMMFPDSYLTQFGLWSLILIESTSALIRTMSYQSAPPVSVSKEVMGAPDSSIKSDEVGKVKQTLQMWGSALLILPFGLSWLGLLTLLFSIPLALESLRRKIKTEVVYASIDCDAVTGEEIAFLCRARSLGSRLLVGVVERDSNETADELEARVTTISMLSCVDEVLPGAPERANAAFVEQHGVTRVAYALALLASGGSVDDFVAPDVDQTIVVGI